MTKVIKLRESDIHRMVKRVLKEDNSTQYNLVIPQERMVNRKSI